MKMIQEEEEENDSKLSISDNSTEPHLNTKKLKTKQIKVTFIELGD